MRKNIDAAEYKHYVLGLLFLKYVSDAFEELHQKILNKEGDKVKLEVKRVLRMYKYPPDDEPRATETVLEQRNYMRGSWCNSGLQYYEGALFY